MLNNIFHSITDFSGLDFDSDKDIISYYYQGICPQTGQLLQLPRNLLIEKIAYQLMKELEKEIIYNIEGKMYGVLLVKNNANQLGVIKAFSGLINGQSYLQGWVTGISGKENIILEENLTLQKLDQIKLEIISLENLPQRKEYNNLLAKYEKIRGKINLIQQKRKQLRQEKRDLLGDNITEKIKEKLENQSRLDGIKKRNFKRYWQKILQPLELEILQADKKILSLKRERKNLSRNLQDLMQKSYQLTNFNGLNLSLSEIIKTPFFPTGTGECCAPKLLNYAANNNLEPIAMAEFWWGKDNLAQNKNKGHFYPACKERCQPLMGYLLSGINTKNEHFNNYEIPLIYEDEHLLIVNKPSGLLSVPGRGSHHYDSIATRLNLTPVHRLDQDTSGLLILAKNQETEVKMKQLFQQKKVKKQYEAILEREITRKSGIIDLPLWGNPENRPFQEVNYEKGKPSQTFFQNLTGSRIIFQPLTGRTHQIRVHSQKGLGVAILGDRLYGTIRKERLYLHACSLEFEHPIAKNSICVKIESQF